MPVPWNKGLKGVQIAWNKGLTKASDARVRTNTARWRASMIKSKGWGRKKGKRYPGKSSECKRGDKNPIWRGNKVGYSALHMWVRKNYGTPQHCEKCGTTENRRYHWANRSGRYLRRRDDWIRLCVPCHVAFDSRRRKRRTLQQKGITTREEIFKNINTYKYPMKTIDYTHLHEFHKTNFGFVVRQNVKAELKKMGWKKGDRLEVKIDSKGIYFTKAD